MLGVRVKRAMINLQKSSSLENKIFRSERWGAHWSASSQIEVVDLSYFDPLTDRKGGMIG